MGSLPLPPEPQETENRMGEFRAVVLTGCPQEYLGELHKTPVLKPYPRPINQNLWGGAQALVVVKVPQVN